jgi:DNA polymerase I-like protein with 3'-5' exonuclease and polymerase domains
MLAHYVSRWDNGEYAEIVANGKKELGTDPHSWLRDLIGVDIIGKGEAGRDNAKTVMYADLYGAGDEKRGAIVLPRAPKKEKIELGKEIGAKMASNFTAKANLQSAIEAAVEANGFLKGLDGRTLRVRKAHAALNTLLQSAGAIVMKKSLVILDAELTANSLMFGPDYEFVANIHDEVQTEVLPQHSDIFCTLASQAVPAAGIALRVKCPLKAEAGAGLSWKFTH